MKPTNEDGTPAAPDERPLIELTPFGPGARRYRYGETLVVVSKEPQGMHVSLSAHHRYPSWDELRDAAWRLCPGISFMVIVPARDDEKYVNLQGNVIHLWQMKGK